MVCRRTRRKTRKTKRNRRRGGRRRRTRHRGGGVAENASPVVAEIVDVEGEAVADNKAEDGGKAQKGGKRRGRKRKSSKKKQKGGKRKLNAYFKAMLSAKKSNAASFKYKGKTYKGRKHNRLGMIYSKA